MPPGKQLASGSSVDSRSRETLTAQGCKGSFSPGLRAFEISPIKLGSGPQIPERSGLPPAARGVGPAALYLSRSRLRIGTPPPAGLTPGGSGSPSPDTEVPVSAKMAAHQSPFTIHQPTSLPLAPPP